MSIEAWITAGVVGLVLAALTLSRRGPDIILWGGLTLLLVVPFPAADGQWQVGVVGGDQVLRGLANEGIATIAALFIVAAAIRQTGGLSWVASRLLGRPRGPVEAQARIMLPTGVMSAFVNNTPLVAMLLPVVDDWTRRSRIAASRLLIPLSYASIFGGACTLIGTSTNLIVNGWLIDHREQLGWADFQGLGMFEMAWVGVPCAVVGIGFVLLTGRWLLPNRASVISPTDDARQYTTELAVEAGSPLVGRSIEAAGLRQLPGLFLMEIDRGGTVIAAPSPQVQLEAGDQLVFAGILESVVDLHRIRGLSPATDQVTKLQDPPANRTMVEAVISHSCPIVGRSIRAGRFRTRYNAAVIAVARNGEQIRGVKLGDVVLQAGDTVLLVARPSFVKQHRDSSDFYLVSGVADSEPVRHERASVALGILVAMVAVVASGVLSMFQAAMVAAGLVLVTRCCTGSRARRSIDWQVLLVIAAALGLGEAMASSGLADVLGRLLTDLAGGSARTGLALVFGLTMILAAVITAKAAAVLVLPIALQIAAQLGISPMPLVIAVMIAAATSVATPIGYPTNLMVLGPGGYRFVDYLKIGGPLSLIIWVMCVWLIPQIWPFT